MNWRSGAKLGAAALISLGLAGCIDATMEIDVLSDTTARATMTQIMGAEFYAMSKMGAAASPQGETSISTDFCDDGQLTENADGGATCVITKEGLFAEIDLGDDADDSDDVTITPAGPGLVRVGFPTTGLSKEIGADEATDPETQQMMQAFFTGHAVTFRVRGNDIVETNMTEAADGKSAETMVPFIDIINGTANLPDELYAVVRTN